MRMLVLILGLFAVSLSLGCDAESEDTSAPALHQEAQPLEQKTASGEAPQVFCNTHCDCQQGTKCSANTCVSIPVFGGGSPPFPEGPSCVADCQCVIGRYCDMRNVSYGYCMLP